MSDIALYRKYRPKDFKEVLGQDHIVKTLEGAIKQGAVSHAYLFSGSRGTGKTSVARILAKEIGTTEKDIYEMDAASNRGIDDIREIREAVNTYPYDSKYKVYIVDEAHMLTKDAFNALLKTLEEPPEHAIFILATTEIGKLPDTVISRCQVLEFKKPNQHILKEMIERVAKSEGYKIDKKSVELISVMADGSYRDALGILQKVINASHDKKIEIEEVEKITGAPKITLINDFISALNAGNTESALKAVRDAGEGNVDMKIFMKLALAKVRAVLLLKFAPALGKYFEEEFGEDDFKLLSELSRIGDGKINEWLLSRLLEAYNGLGRSFIESLPIELAIISMEESI